MKNSLKSLAPHLAAIFTFLIVAIMYFFPQLQGKVLKQSDLSHFTGMAQEVRDYESKSGEQTLWTNSMFSGMPTYQITAPQKKNISKPIKKILSLGFNSSIGVFISGMIGFYILLILFGVNPWLSIIGAIAFALGTNNLVLFGAGHFTKVSTIFMSAPIIAGVLLAYRGKYLLGATVFCIFMSLNLYSNHPQMTYYLALCLGIFVLIQFVSDIKAKKLKSFAIASSVLVLASILSLGTAASKIMTTLEYGEDTMRGSSVLKSENPDPSSSSEIDGLAWEYAMSWSNGPVDLLSSFIPRVVGGSSGETLSTNSALAKDLSRKGVNVREGIVGPMYWGDLPSTSGPIYFGAVIFFLFILGALIVDQKYKWWIVGSVVLLMLLSLGKNLEWFNKLFFDYMPLYNKFRTPNSILSVAAIFIPFLAFLGAQKILDSDLNKEKAIKKLLIAGGSLGGICLLLAIAGPSLFDVSTEGDAQYSQMGYSVDAIIQDRKSMLRGDSFRSFMLIALSAVSIWLYLKSKISSKLMIGAISLLILFDVWTIGKKYINNDDFQTERVSGQTYVPRPVDTQLLEDPDPHYRVLDLSVNTFNTAIPSYFHKTIGGYHAAKLLRYQDLIERHISVNNQRVLNMLNTKYFIMPDANRVPQAQLNPAALGNAWFVNKINLVENANAEIDGLTNFDPAGEAIVHKEFADYVSGLNPSKNGSISLTEYKPNAITYSSNATSDQFAVFSEVWYGPDKGWQAYIDGNEVEHIRTNYALRGLKIPAGQHEVKFVFHPQTYYTAETISLISSLVLLGGFLFFLWKIVIPYFKKMDQIPTKPNTTKKKVVKKKVKKTSRKRK